MLIANTPVLTVRRISAHLGVEDWNIARELKMGARKQPGRLRGTKAQGAGQVGQGGQWQVQFGDYLDWLGVPDTDRPASGSTELPVLHPLAQVAATEKMSLTDLREILDVHALTHLRVGRRRYLTASQLAALQAWLREHRTPASR